MTMRTLPTLLALVLSLSACATLTPYQPLREGLGYSEQKLESNRYRVTYTASARTPRATVEDYLLYRAAELTLALGYDGFVLGTKTFQGAPGESGASIGLGGYGSSSGRSGIGIGIGTSLGSPPPYQGYIEVFMYRGARPAQDAQAFDARELQASLAPRVLPPGDASGR